MYSNRQFYGNFLGQNISVFSEITNLNRDRRKKPKIRKVLKTFQTARGLVCKALKCVVYCGISGIQDCILKKKSQSFFKRVKLTKKGQNKCSLDERLARWSLPFF